MNPYDFVRIDWTRPPERRKPIWHHRLTGNDGQYLYAGHFDVDLYVETPLFIADPGSASDDPKRPDEFIQNSRGEYIIPGSSLKGMIRQVVESLGNGCLTLFDGEYERKYGRERPTYEVDYRRNVPVAFQHCTDNTKLCLACRTFGMLGPRNGGILLGKVNIGDAVVYEDTIAHYDAIYTQPLMTPHPHHADFYLDEQRKYISGRKFYFHHSAELEPLTSNRQEYMGGKKSNRYIRPLDRDTGFHFRIDFTNLEQDEFLALLYAVTLDEDVRHKIGYAKPLGLGTIELRPTSITLIDYARRYSASGRTSGKTVYDGDELWPYIYERSNDFLDHGCVEIAREDLRRIWRWPADKRVDYRYPSKRDWFDTPASKGKRIADTRQL